MPADRLVLLRHGRTAANASGIWQGQLDVPLDEVGHAQAAAAARVLTSLEPARVLASDLSRAAQTADPLGRACGLDVGTDPAFREVYAGRWQGLSGTEIEARWPDERASWAAGDPDARPGGGESRQEAGERVAAGLRDAVEQTSSGTLVVVGHGGSLRFALVLLLAAPGATWLGRIPNCGWSVLSPAADGWRLDAFNVTAPAEAAGPPVPVGL